MTIREELAKLEPSGVVRLVELDAQVVGAGTLRFHGYKNTPAIFWQGQQYDPWPLDFEGFARTSEQQPRPKVRVGNVGGAITTLCQFFDDLVGSRITRKSTLVRFLDSENSGTRTNLVANSEGPMSTYSHKVGCEDAGPGHGFDNWVKVPYSEDGDTYAYHLRQAGATGVVSLFVRREDYGPITIATSGDFTFTGGASPDTVVETSIPGVYRISRKAAASGSTFGVVNRRAGNAVDIYVTGYQFEEGDEPTPYIPTHGEPVTVPNEINPTADPTQEMTPEVWYIERKTTETPEVVEFELVSPLELQNAKWPRRQIIPNVCPWLVIGGYRGPYCGYTGPPVAKIDDTPTSDPALDQCGGRLRSCKLRFGENNELPFGGFPAARLIR